MDNEETVSIVSEETEVVGTGLNSTKSLVSDVLGAGPELKRAK